MTSTSHFDTAFLMEPVASSHLEPPQSAPIGRQLGAVLNEAKNPFLLIVGQGVEVAPEAVADLRDGLMRERDLAMAYPVTASGALAWAVTLC